MATPSSPRAPHSRSSVLQPRFYQSTELFRGLCILFSLIVLSGCTTVTRGTKEKLIIQSTPTGADVYLSTGEHGVTPTSFEVYRTSQLDVRIQKVGYKPTTVQVKPERSVGATAASLAPALVSLGVTAIVDNVNGSTLSLKPNPINITLIEASEEEKQKQLTEIATAKESLAKRENEVKKVTDAISEQFQANWKLLVEGMAVSEAIKLTSILVPYSSSIDSTSKEISKGVIERKYETSFFTLIFLNEKLSKWTLKQ
jgi:hypothetical protein